MKTTIIKFGIYIIKNKTNGKFYIGSSNHVYKRWWAHRRSLNSKRHINNHLQNSWNVYGAKSFDFLIDKEMPGASDKELKDEEQLYLDKYWDGGNQCYNVAKIADRPDGELYKIAIDQLDKNTGELIKTWKSATDIENEHGYLASCVGNCCRGKLITFMGYKWRYSDPELAKKYKPKEPCQGEGNKKRVLQINVNNKKIIKRFNTIEDAARELNIKRSTISFVCSGSRTNAKGLVFCFEKDYEMKYGMTLKQGLGIETDTNNNQTKPSIPQTLDSTPTMKCLECGIDGFLNSNLKSLSTHIQFAHKMNSEQYTIRNLYGNKRPTCGVEGCEVPVRYTTFSFKKYCKTHSFHAESAGGKIGGRASKKKSKNHN